MVETKLIRAARNAYFVTICESEYKTPLVLARKKTDSSPLDLIDAMGMIPPPSAWGHDRLREVVCGQQSVALFPPNNEYDAC